MEHYLQVVKYNAERIHAKLPSEVDIEDLMSAGVFGLMDAIDVFDLSRGVKFETYCAPRIRGAILDELRSMDWVPRLVRSRTGKVEQAKKQLEMRYDRPPTDDEIAKTMDVSDEEYQKNPISVVQKCDLKKGPSRVERLILIFYYYKEMTMKEIGVTLDLSESRVSQMHSSILARLKAQLRHSDKALEMGQGRLPTDDEIVKKFVK